MAPKLIPNLCWFECHLTQATCFCRLWWSYSIFPKWSRMEPQMWFVINAQCGGIDFNSRDLLPAKSTTSTNKILPLQQIRFTPHTVHAYFVGCAALKSFTVIPPQVNGSLYWQAGSQHPLIEIANLPSSLHHLPTLDDSKIPSSIPLMLVDYCFQMFLIFLMILLATTALPMLYSLCHWEWSCHCTAALLFPTAHAGTVTVWCHHQIVAFIFKNISSWHHSLRMPPPLWCDTAAAIPAIGQHSVTVATGWLMVPPSYYCSHCFAAAFIVSPLTFQRVNNLPIYWPFHDGYF